MGIQATVCCNQEREEGPVGAVWAQSRKSRILSPSGQYRRLSLMGHSLRTVIAVAAAASDHRILAAGQARPFIPFSLRCPW